MSKETKKITTSGLICALHIVILLIGVMPGFIYVSINVAIWSLSIIKKRFGTKYWAMCYIAASILDLLLIPDLEVSLTCVCMGWYPLVRDIINKNKNTVIKSICKTTIFIIASIIIYNISIRVFGTDAIIEEIPFFEVFYVAIFTSLFWILNLMMYTLDIGVAKRLTKRKHKN